jgi:hypothetical protein
VMPIERVTQVGWVRERYVPGVGATPVLHTYRVGYAALVAPAPGTSCTHKISDADTGLIRAGY